MTAYLSQAQGTFQNLDFESASVIPIPGDTFNRIQFNPAFLGWTGSVGGVQQNAVLYNNAFLDTSAIGILDQAADNAPNPLVHGRIIQGSYTALLMAGIGGDTTLVQTGLIPVNAQSLRFSAYSYSLNPVTFGVTLGGQNLSLMPIQNGPRSIVYGADIQAFAGQTVAMAFTTFAQQPHVSNNYFFLDSIQFSTEPIPEPGAGMIFLLGLGAMAFSKTCRR